MIPAFKDIKSVGFDLDGTMYVSDGEIDNRIRTKISEKILYKIPSLGSVREARKFFEEQYKILHSGTKVLGEVGYERPSKVMDECLSTADVLDLISENKNLNRIMKNLKNKYDEVYLLTSSPYNLSIKKLDKLGISLDNFSNIFCGDNLGVGSKIDGGPFDYVLGKSNYNPEKHVYIGDRLDSDILPAKERGMKTIAVNKNIKEADISILDINELENILL